MGIIEIKAKSKNKNLGREKDKLLPLNIPGPNDEPGITFPGAVIENMRYLLTRVGNKEPIPSSISMVSALREEGVTYLSLALAATIANDLMNKVCVVDLNWHWSSPSPLVDPAKPGLAGVITGKADLDEILVPTGLRNLWLAPAGFLPPGDRPVTARSQQLTNTLKKLGERFDHLILATYDSVPLASRGVACCMIIRQRATSLDDVRAALDEIAHLKILGVVLNRVRYSTPKNLIKSITAR